MRIYNTLSGTKEEFIPLHGNKVNMYACGITVSGEAHIGHAYQALIYDIIRKFLIKQGYDVTYARNYTDVDDKIIARAKEAGIPADAYAKMMIKKIDKVMREMEVDDPDIWLKATDNIDNIIDFVSELVKKGHAYPTAKGDVYFSVESFAPYGRLSHRNLEDALNGVRIENDDEKKNPLDFALWKSAKEGEICWDSPWGKGRPGWHIECSAMNRKAFGDEVDIHGGGRDLIFPHHENEIAQSEAHNGCEFSHYWMHNGYINIDGTKMSKSLGNFKTVRDLLQHYDGEVLRFLILSGQYRGPIDFNSEILEQSRNAMTRLRNAKSNLNHLIETGSGSMTDEEKEKLAGYDKYRQEFIKAMDDDLNTADAISAVFELVTAINTAVKDGASKEFAEKSLATLMELATVLGLLQQDVEEKVEIDDELAALIEERQQARKEKNFARADEIRDMLKARGLILSFGRTPLQAQS